MIRNARQAIRKSRQTIQEARQTKHTTNGYKKYDKRNKSLTNETNDQQTKSQYTKRNGTHDKRKKIGWVEEKSRHLKIGKVQI